MYPWRIQQLVSTYSNCNPVVVVKICQDLPKFQFSGEGVVFVLYQIPEQGVLTNLSTNFALPLSGSPCITDSLSHTTYVETNKI